MQHEDYMQIAIQYARNTNPDWPFGTVIVDTSNGEVLIVAVNASHINPIFHGEITAISALKKGYDKEQLSHPLILYTTAECCPMCQTAIHWARIDGINIQTVVYGTRIATLHRLWDTQVNIPSQEIVDKSPNDSNKIILMGGILEAECNQLFEQAKKKQDTQGLSQAVLPTFYAPTMADVQQKPLSQQLTDFYKLSVERIQSNHGFSHHKAKL